MARDWRDERIEELEAQVADLTKRLAELEALLGRNSSNSNQPHSKDSPEERRNRPKKRKSGRRQGAQPGHRGHQRELLPPEKVTKFVDCCPPECEACHATAPTAVDAEPGRHQVLELPKIEPLVTEYRKYFWECGDCGHFNRGRLPEGTPRSMFGPRLLALVALLTGPSRLSRRQASAFLAEVLGVSVSLGALSEAEGRVSEAIAPAVEKAREFALAQPIKHADATTWYCRGKSRALWTLTTAFVAVFAILEDGTKTTLQKFLTRVHGFLISDRAKVFNFWAMAQRQICWAHLARKFAGFAERKGTGRQIARELLETTHLVFHYWHRVRDGTMTRAQFQQWTMLVRARMELLLERGFALQVRGFSGTCWDILEHRAALWTFADHEGVEPTNNMAEGDLRPGVIWRKTSFGSQSDRGERYAERILTVTHTLRKQRRSVFEYLHHACANALYNNPPPSLLPSSSSNG